MQHTIVLMKKHKILQQNFAIIKHLFIHFHFLYHEHKKNVVQGLQIKYDYNCVININDSIHV